MYKVQSIHWSVGDTQVNKTSMGYCLAGDEHDPSNAGSSLTGRARGTHVSVTEYTEFERTKKKKTGKPMLVSRSLKIIPLTKKESRILEVKSSANLATGIYS